MLDNIQLALELTSVNTNGTTGEGKKETALHLHWSGDLWDLWGLKTARRNRPVLGSLVQRTRSMTVEGFTLRSRVNSFPVYHE